MRPNGLVPAVILAVTCLPLVACESKPAAPPPEDPRPGVDALGKLEVIDADGVGTGWAAAKSAGTRAVAVAFYVDGDAKTGTLLDTVVASDKRDVSGATGIPGDHGFHFTISDALRDGKTHPILAYAIAPSGLVALDQAVTAFKLGSRAPMGYFDGIDADGNAAGWALVPALAPAPIDVKLYLDGPSGSGALLSTVSANQPRADVNQATGQPGDHGFAFAIPDAARDGKDHQLFAYAVGPKSEVLLDPSPLGFKIAPRIIQRQGMVRLDGRSLVDDTGHFNALGATLFSAARWYKFDLPRLERNLKFLSENGYDYIRVIGLLGWAGREVDPRWPDYDAVIAGVTDLAYDKYGIRVEWTIFGGTDFTPAPADRLALVDRFLAMSKGRENKIILFEAANEYWQNGFGGDPGRAELRGLAQHLNDSTGILVAVSSPTSWDDEVTLYTGGIADIITIHPDRNTGVQPDGPWRAVRQPWGEPNGAAGNVVASDDEPIGPGSSVASERDPLRLVMHAVTAQVSGLPFYTFHSRAGVGADYANCASLGTCDLNGDKDLSEMPGANGFRAMKRYLPAGIENWTRQNHYWAGHPFRVYGDGQLNFMTTDGAQNGVMRAYAAVSGDNEFVVALLRIVGTLRLEAKNDMKLCAVNPLTGAIVERHALAANEAVTFDGNALPGLVLRGKIGGADDGCQDWSTNPDDRWSVAIGASAQQHPDVTVPDETWGNIVATNTGNTTWYQGDVAFQCESTTGNWTFHSPGTELHTADWANWLDWPVAPGKTVGLRVLLVPDTATPTGQAVAVGYRCQLAHGPTRFGPYTPELTFKLAQN
jgi:hypothetical protein